MKIDSSNLRSWEGHLANTEKLSTLIGWSKLKACSLMLLKGGFEKGMLVFIGYPFMFTNPTYEMSLSFTNICRLTLTTGIFINNIGRHYKWDLIFKEEQRAYSFLLIKMHLKLAWGNTY